MKKIIVKWTPEKPIYTKAMHIIYSDHERFISGSRFDFGFLKIASEEGFIIEILP